MNTLETSCRWPERVRARTQTWVFLKAVGNWIDNISPTSQGRLRPDTRQNRNTAGLGWESLRDQSNRFLASGFFFSQSFRLCENFVWNIVSLRPALLRTSNYETTLHTDYVTNRSQKTFFFKVLRLCSHILTAWSAQRRETLSFSQTALLTCFVFTLHRYLDKQTGLCEMCLYAIADWLELPCQLIGGERSNEGTAWRSS